MFQEDIGRIYYIKEKRLVQLLFQVLGLEGLGRSSSLMKWNETGDLSSVIQNIVSESVF